jgi:hypothetical protein
MKSLDAARFCLFVVCFIACFVCWLFVCVGWVRVVAILLIGVGHPQNCSLRARQYVCANLLQN